MYEAGITSDRLFDLFNLAYDDMEESQADDKEDEEEADLFTQEELEKLSAALKETLEKKEEEKQDAEEFKQNDLTAAVEEALLQTEQEDVKESKPRAPRILQDFGKKIGGARKDAFAAYRELLLDANAHEVDSTYTLRTNWPQPKYQKLIDAGVEPWKIAAIRALREANTPKPTKGGRYPGKSKSIWRARLLETRNLASSILTGEMTRDEFIKYLASDERGKFIIDEAYHPVRLPEEPDDTYKKKGTMLLPDTDEVLYVNPERFRSDFYGKRSAYRPDPFTDYTAPNAKGFAYYDYTHIYHTFRLYEALGHDHPLSGYRVKEEPVPLKQEGDSIWTFHALLTADALNHQYALFESSSKKDITSYSDYDHIDKKYYGQIGVYKTFEEMTDALKARLLSKNAAKKTAETKQDAASLFEMNKGGAFDYFMYWDDIEHSAFKIVRKIGKISVVISHHSLSECEDPRQPWKFKHDHLEEIQKAFSDMIGPNLEILKKYHLAVSRFTGEYKFIRKVPRDEIILHEEKFADTESATRYLVDHVTEFEEAYKDGRNVPFERNKENEARTGKRHEHGDITPEEYMKKFGFRGVEFGNWLTGKDRQNRLNDSYDALLDLADVMGVEPQALSLGGTLSMRFGSNGRGGKNAAMAHFEHDYNAINLTKENGAGCLAHEWFHALDYHLGHKAELEMLSDSFYLKAQGGSLSEDTKDTFFKLHHLLYQETMIKERSASLDAHTSHSSKPYWSKDREMLARTFEAYVNSKLADKGIHNDFLVNIKSEKTWDAETKGRKASYLNKSYPYPLESEMPIVKEKFDAFINAMSTRKVNGKVEFFSCSNHETLGEMTEQCRAVPDSELSGDQKAWKDFGENVLGLHVQIYDGPQELHGKYDAANNMLYLNRDSELDYRWTFYHEAFHALKNNDPELYEDLLKATESTSLITKDQIEAYRQSIHASDLSDAQIKEEMLADAFADQKSDTRAINHLATRTPTIANRLMTSIRKLASKAQSFFCKQNKVGLTTKQAADFKDRLEDIAQNLIVNGTTPLADIHNVLGRDGYPIIPRADALNHIPTVYPHDHDKQLGLDISAARELLKVYPENIVRETIQNCSPQKIPNRTAYADKVIKGAMNHRAHGLGAR